MVCWKMYMPGAIINVLHGDSFNLHKQPQIGIIIVLTFQMREPRCRKIKHFAKCHIASNSRGNPNLGYLLDNFSLISVTGL